MKEINTDEAAPKARWGRRLAILGVFVLVLLVVAYFVVSSSAFLKGVVLPRVAKAMHADITVAEISLSPFSRLTLDKLKVQTTGTEPLLIADQVRVRYSLFSILNGKYIIDEVTLNTPVIQILKDPSGKSNLDPLTQSSGSSSPSAKSEEPLQLSIRNVSVKDGTVRMTDRAKDGSVKTTEIGQLTVAVDQVGNGQSGKMTIGSKLRMENRVPAGQPGTNDVLEGKVDGSFAFKLDAKLLPQTLSGNANVAATRAEGTYAQFSGLGAVLQAELTPTEVRQLQLRFERGGQSLGRIQGSGPLDLAKAEGRVKIEVQSLDRQVLNLVGSSRGWDFGQTTLNATNYIDIARAGDVIGAKGQVVGRQVTIQQESRVTPAIDLDLDYDVTLNRTDQAAVIHRFGLVARQQQSEFLRGSLDRPMTLTWAANAKGFADSTFQLGLTNLNLKDWQAMLGTNAPTGRLDLQLNVVAKEDGKRIGARGGASLQDFSTAFGTNRLENANVKLAFEGLLENFKTLHLQPCTIEVQQLSQVLVKANGSLDSDVGGKDMNLQINAEVALPALLRSYAIPTMTASNGVARLNAAVTQKGQKYTATGYAFLGDFAGTYGAYSFNGYQGQLDYNVNLERPAVQIHSASLTLRQGYSPGGSITLSGDYNIEQSSGQGTFKLVDFNQNALAPFLAPSLGDKKLVSISISGAGSAAYDPKGDTTLKAGLVLTNWVVSAPQQQFTSPNLGGQVQLDGSLRQQVLDLRQCLVKLSPTTRAKNELELKAHLDMNKTNASPSQLSVASDSLDLTPYYEMFAGKTATNTTAAPSRPGAPASSDRRPTVEGKPMEPEAMKLPIDQLVADVKIGKIFLRQIAITNLEAKAQIQRGEVTVKPLQLTLNGAPVRGSAVVNVGVPGYTYDVSFDADRVPIEPLSNSLTTNAPGVYKGDLIAQAQIKGAGVTGPSLQKNLNGNLSLNLTNLNYEIVGAKVKRLIEPISLALRVPELMQTPLNWISAKADAGKGQINLQQFTVQSQAFYAESHGVVTIAEVLTNSPLKLPVTLSLRRTLAEKANLLAPNTPTNVVYAPLPSFVTLSGTAGDPKTEINKLVIGGLLAKSIGGLLPVGDKASNILQGLGGALSGQPSATSTNNAGTNATANLIQGIGSLIAQPKKTTAPATNAPATTTRTNKPAKPNALDLLNQLIPEKK